MNWIHYLEFVLKLKSPEQLKDEAIRNNMSAKEYFAKLEATLKTKREYYLKFVRLMYIGYMVLSPKDHSSYFIEPLEDTNAKTRKIPKIGENDVELPRKHYRLLSRQEIDEALEAVSNHKTKDRSDDVNRILYAMLKTQDRFGIIDETIPNTLNILSCLKDLSFSSFANQYASTKQGDARSVVEAVLPYRIACGKQEAKKIKDRVEARLVGHEILLCLNNMYYEEDVEKPYKLFDTEQVINAKTTESIVKRFSEKSGNRLLNIMNAVRGETYSIINDDVLGQAEERTPFFKLSLIYACSNLGEENIEGLFSMNEDELKDRVTTLKEKNKPKTRAKQRRSLWIR